MSKKDPNKRRVCKAIKSPFTVEELKSFLESIPKESKLRLASVTRGSAMITNAPAPAEFIEALWWEPIEAK